MRVALLLLCGLFYGLVTAQLSTTSKIDSLENELRTIYAIEREQPSALINERKIDALCELSRAYDGTDSTKTFNLARKALELSSKIKYRKGSADANYTMGRAYMYVNPDSALVYLTKSVAILENLQYKTVSDKLKELWVKSNYNLGLTYGYLGQHNEELEITEMVLPIVKELKDSLFLANVYTNLGVKNINLVNYIDAYQSLVKGEVVYAQLGYPEQATFNLIQLAMVQERLDSLPQMNLTLTKVEELLERYPNTFDQFNFNLQKSQYQLRTKEYKSSLKTLDKAYNFVKNYKSSNQYGMVMQRYAKLYEQTKMFDSASSYITKYLNHSLKSNDGIGVFQAYYSRSKINASAKDYKSAYKDMLAAVDIYDSIEIQASVKKSKELELKYTAAEKERQILALENERNENALALEKQKSRTYFYGMAIGLLGLLIVLGYIFYRNKLRKTRRKQRLKEAELDLLKQEQQNKIFSAMIEGQEKERKRLAIDLHDGLGGRLSGISLNLSKLDKDEPSEYPKDRLLKVMKDLDDSLSELRVIARNLMPETLVKFGLHAALKDYCTNMTGTGTKVTLQFYGNENGIDLNHQVTIFRVIQELINNAVKHAKATEVLIQFIREGNTIDITVEDNGIGMSKEILEKEQKGMGLSNLRTRIAYLKGELDFHSIKNEGTTVNIHLNINAA
ncbi:sensor histidine kinase [Flavobacterium sp. ASW18X]|uniref:sensor histidine kinase n=1 Tax=Flavobacterium sp. ASW18X TaxID=2572595 RepID=UPI0010ADBD8C|nr:sensor histidine kinase [Flavobacterium sp. ASW18X]TKD66508.1 sensor histidine kinase [Flavobacterium sp. ASW18X]